MKKILSILFLLHLCFGLLIPSITVLCFNIIEESIDWVASESDNEVEEKNEEVEEELEEEDEPEVPSEIQTEVANMEAPEEPTAEVEDEKKQEEDKPSSGSFFDQFD